MKRRGYIDLSVSVLSLVVLSISFASTAHADRFTSPNYTIDASSTGSSLSGAQSSTSYQLVSSGGESVIGNAASGSYKLGQGYVSQLDQSLQLSVTPSTINIGAVTPGVSNTATFTASILTDAPGYTLGVSQDTDLQSGANTIPAVAGSIASPLTWSEGSTKGLGFSLVNTNATAIPGKWSSGNAYAAFPASSTVFYNRTGYTGGATDTLDMRVRLDTTSAQVAGNYTNTVTWIGTTTP